LSAEEIYRKVAELIAQGGTQLLMQGGLHPQLGIEFFEELFRGIKGRFPEIRNHSLSPAEISHIARLSGLTIAEAVCRLKEAGLDSIPGGGAEILVDRVRAEISPDKIGWEEWAEVMRGRSPVSTTAQGQPRMEKPETEHPSTREIRSRRDVQRLIPGTHVPGNAIWRALLPPEWSIWCCSVTLERQNLKYPGKLGDPGCVFAQVALFSCQHLGGQWRKCRG
jgi:cyclic dehypoxanthinyl futalosine synthase